MEWICAALALALIVALVCCYRLNQRVKFLKSTLRGRIKSHNISTDAINNLNFKMQDLKNELHLTKLDLMRAQGKELSLFDLSDNKPNP